MKSLNGNRVKLVVIGFVAGIVLGGGTANGDFTFGEPTIVPNINSDYGDIYVRIAADGLSMYITSQRPGGYGDLDIWVAKRPTRNDEWGAPVNLGPKINTSGWDAGASISVDNLALYFYSQDRPGGYGGFDLWLSTRETTEDDWGDPVNLGPTFNTTGHNWAPNISADNLSLYFTCDRPGGSGAFDMWVCARETIQDNWGTPVHLGFTVNWPYWDCKPDISADGRTLFFTRIMKYHPGVDEDFDIWVARRASPHDDWGEPVPLPINTSYAEGSTSISADGSTLYFMSNRPQATPSGDIWQVAIEPVVDLNTDSMVNGAEICIMLESWGTDDPLCDIGPAPWGDGIVDVRDLIVLMEYMTDGKDNVTETKTIIYVDDDAVGSNDGSSWANAFNYLQDALGSVNSADKPVEIRVAQGIYKPDQGANQTLGDKDATFKLSDDVLLKGGFAGFGESESNAWDVDLYETILSGDLSGNDIDFDSLEGREPTRTDNSCYVLTISGNIRAATLDGFTITGGDSMTGPCRAGYGPFGDGSGLNARLENADGNITVLNCTFSRNYGAIGGGIRIMGGSWTMADCTFRRNVGANGGGMLICAENLRLTNCVFNANFAGQSYEAAGIDCNDVVLTNCLFAGNVNLRGERGGPMLFIDGNAILTNCTFTDNVSNGVGARIHINDSAILTNCILRNGGNEIVAEDESRLYITYSNIEGGWPGIGNIDADPLFANPGYWDLNDTPDDPIDDLWVDGDYYLKSQAGRWDPMSESWILDNVTGPCIDAGDPEIPVGDEPKPHGSRINMGAYGGTDQASKSP